MSFRPHPLADEPTRDLVNQLNQREARAAYPTRPHTLQTIADVASLPRAADWKAGQVFVSDIDGAGTPGIAFSDGTNWRRCDTLATL